MSEDKQKPEARGYKREEGVPKNGFGDDLAYRIKGLEQAKMEPGMSPADIAALDRLIVKLKKDLGVKEPEPKEQF